VFKRIGIGFAAGYVVGAKGGEHRYEQLVKLGERVMSLPSVRKVTDEAEDNLRDSGRNVLEAIRSRFGGHADDSDEGEDDDVDAEMEDDSVDEVDEEDSDDEDSDEDSAVAETDQDDDEDSDEDSAAAETDQDDDGDSDEEDQPATETDQDDGVDEESDDDDRDHERRSLVSSISGFATAAFERGKVA
jgi:hypothetical protein